MKDLIAQILEETAYEQNPYFVALRDGTFEKEDFVETQIQFYSAVVFFGRPMAIVVAKIPHHHQRIEVLRNVWEEHGTGGEELPHGDSFLEFLKRLDGVTFEDVQKRTLWPEVRLFNTALIGCCTMDEYIVGVGMLGIIERMFADISGWIGRAVVERGWIAQEDLIHYDLHSELDIKHADDFFDVLGPTWESGGEEDRYFVEQGLRLGAHTFSAMYEQLYVHRKRRRVRDVTCSHVRT